MKLIVALFLCLLSLSLAAGDMIVTRSGKIIDCEVLKYENGKLKIRLPDGTERIGKLKDVASIVFSTKVRMGEERVAAECPVCKRRREMEAAAAAAAAKNGSEEKEAVKTKSKNDGRVIVTLVNNTPHRLIFILEGPTKFKRTLPKGSIRVSLKAGKYGGGWYMWTRKRMMGINSQDFGLIDEDQTWSFTLKETPAGKKCVRTVSGLTKVINPDEDKETDTPVPSSFKDSEGCFKY